MSHYKYPKTLHLPWSPGTTIEDKFLDGIDHFIGAEVVVTEKLDGENTNLYSDHFHARSLEGAYYPHQAPVKNIHGRIRHEIPDEWRISGENMYAKHSIVYEELTDWFYVFSIWNERNECLSWDDTKSYAKILGLSVAPEIYIGKWDQRAVQECWSGKSAFGNEQEGYVVRKAGAFNYDQFSNNVAKWVRANHVQTDEFWRKNWIPNKLKK